MRRMQICHYKKVPGPTWLIYNWLSKQSFTNNLSLIYLAMCIFSINMEITLQHLYVSIKKKCQYSQ